MSENESADDPRLLSVADSISDGANIDWKAVEDSVDLEQSPIVEELRVLEGLARFSEPTPADWGPFTIACEIGRGSFGTVYRASDPNLQIEVALKVIRPRFPASLVDPSRALEEARLLAQISHPNVVRVYRAEQIGDEVGVSMELIKGQTLHEIVSRQRYSAREAALIGIDLCRALASVHAANHIHGDIKAHNVMRGEGGRIVLMDFGAGKSLNDLAQPGTDIAGTLLYIGPEVFDGQPRTKASDIYSLGVLLYFLVTGSYPVPGHTRSEITRQHRRRTPPKPLRDARHDLPHAFIRVVDRCIAEKPEDRYQSAGALESALFKALEPTPWRFLPIAAALTLVAGLAAGFAYWTLYPRQTASASNPAGAIAAGLTPSATAPTPAVQGADTYRIDAAFYREQRGVEMQMQPGMRLAPGDRLSLRLQVSVPAYVYVVNEDEQGESYLLFPRRGGTLTNPLSAGERHRLPGPEDGEQVSWQVTTAGGREHFLIFVNPNRSEAFEQMFASLPQPTRDKPIQSARLSNDSIGLLRAVGGLTPSSVPVDKKLRLTSDFSTPLTATEETARGVWVRQLTIENPRE